MRAPSIPKCAPVVKHIDLFGSAEVRESAGGLVFVHRGHYQGTDCSENSGAHLAQVGWHIV